MIVYIVLYKCIGIVVGSRLHRPKNKNRNRIPKSKSQSTIPYRITTLDEKFKIEIEYRFRN